MTIMFNNTLDKKYPRPFTFFDICGRNIWNLFSVGDRISLAFFKKYTSLCKINVFFVAQWDLGRIFKSLFYTDWSFIKRNILNLRFQSKYCDQKTTWFNPVNATPEKHFQEVQCSLDLWIDILGKSENWKYLVLISLWAPRVKRIGIQCYPQTA